MDSETTYNKKLMSKNYLPKIKANEVTGSVYVVLQTSLKLTDHNSTNTLYLNKR